MTLERHGAGDAQEWAVDPALPRPGRFVFLDVGAHEGQTLDEVVFGGYGFDCIYAFEPMPFQFLKLARRPWGGAPVLLRNYGLSNRSGELPLYGNNDGMEASVYPDKRDVDETVVTTCQFVRASEFFADWLTLADTVVVKLNCEGSEVAILNDLAASGEIWKIANVLIDFDIRKVPGLEPEADIVLDRLARIGFDRYVLAEDVMVGATHQARIRRWLAPVVAGLRP